MEAWLTSAKSRAIIVRVRVERARLVIACSLLIAAAAACSNPVASGSSTTVDTSRPVPSVLGLTAQAATTRLTSAGFTVASQARVFSPTTPAGEVAAQAPAGSHRAPIGSTVSITISEGKGVVVPSVRRLTYDTARHRLALLGLRTSTIQTYSATVGVGLIVSQGSPPGTRVVAGTQVALYVSKGHAPVQIPNVKNKAVATAEAALERAGLVVQLLKAPRKGVKGTCPAGGVYRTFPRSNKLVPFHSTVRVVPCP